jgi:HAD superfamily hydrolase (TIGR01509 family)
MINHLIFDCDGVLIDSEILAAQAMVGALNDHRIPITVNEYLTNCTGKTFSGLKIDLSKEYSVVLPDDFVRLVTENMEALKLQKLKPIQGMLDLLNKVRDIPKAVVSNSDLSQIKSSLTQVGAMHHFETNMFSSEQVQNPKPSPEIYHYAAVKIGIDPKNCLVVEDSISGATAAYSAGMNVVGLLAGSHIVEGHRDRLKDIGIEMIASSTKELEGIINQCMR